MALSELRALPSDVRGPPVRLLVIGRFSLESWRDGGGKPESLSFSLRVLSNGLEGRSRFGLANLGVLPLVSLVGITCAPALGSRMDCAVDAQGEISTKIQIGGHSSHSADNRVITAKEWLKAVAYVNLN